MRLQTADSGTGREDVATACGAFAHHLVASRIGDPQILGKRRLRVFAAVVLNSRVALSANNEFRHGGLLLVIGASRASPPRRQASRVSRLAPLPS